MAQLWYSPISINAAQVPSTQTDFPVLVSVTDARFKDVAHSGHVNRSDGFDIRPYTDTTLGTAITGYELERYTPTTGEVIMWVKVSSLSSSTTPIVLGYGDTSITTDGSSSTTWSNNFLGVYHLKDGTTLNVNSATGSNNGTNHGATATTGKIDGGGGFVSASSQYIDCGNGMNPSALTLSILANATSFPNSYNTTITRYAGTTNQTQLLVKSNGKLSCGSGDGVSFAGYDGTGTNTLSTATWYHLSVTVAASQHVFGYVNGVLDGQSGTNINPATTAASTQIGAVTSAGGLYWNGAQDEARFSSVARSANWLLTESNNQLAPGTFETLGTEVSTTVTGNSNFFLLFP